MDMWVFEDFGTTLHMVNFGSPMCIQPLQFFLDHPIAHFFSFLNPLGKLRQPSLEPLHHCKIAVKPKEQALLTIG